MVYKSTKALTVPQEMFLHTQRRSEGASKYAKQDDTKNSDLSKIYKRPNSMGWSRNHNTINTNIEPVLKRKAASRNKTRKVSNLSRENSRGRPPLNSCKSG